MEIYINKHMETRDLESSLKGLNASQASCSITTCGCIVKSTLHTLKFGNLLNEKYYWNKVYILEYGRITLLAYIRLFISVESWES